MSALFRLFGGNYQLYFVILLLSGLAATSGGFFFERGEAIEYRDKVTALNEELIGAKGALETNSKAVADLQAALEEWKGKAQAATDAEATAEKSLDAQAQAAAAAQLKLQTTERADNARPDCKKLLAMDLGALCPGHAAAVRLRAREPAHLPGPGGERARPDAGGA